MTGIVTFLAYAHYRGNMRKLSPFRPQSGIWYPTGFITLTVVPLVLWLFMARNYYFTRQTAIEVIYSSPRDTAFTPSPLVFVNEKFMKISLDGSRDDEIKLAFARIAIRELIHQSDTTQGIEFNLKPTLKYRTLIELYNICNEEDVRTFMHYGNRFWVFNLRPITFEDDRRHEPSLII